MVLESQIRRTSGRMYTSRRARRGKTWRIFATVALVGAVGVGCYLIIKGSGADDAGPGAADDPAATDTRAGDIAAGSSAPRNTSEQNSGRAGGSSGDHRSSGSSASSGGSSGGSGSDDAAAPPNDPRRATDVPTSSTVARKITQGLDLVDRGERVRGRALLNEALAGPISASDANRVRQAIAAVNEDLIFSPKIVEEDPYVSEHVMEPGTILARIAPEYDVPWRFIQRINRISDPRRIRAGQRLKVVHGPFHVTVDKSDFRADVYLNGADGRMYVRSFPVGLGEYNSTPAGQFVVKPGSKLINPEWTNPRTGQRILADDPDNPIGERWIGLKGIDESTRRFQRYGLHGTIEPDSIGQQASMGCIRFKPDDIELLYAMLVESKSTVTIVN